MLFGVTCDFARERDQPAQTLTERYYVAIQKLSDAGAVHIPMLVANGVWI
jgi:hypothetical protein